MVIEWVSLGNVMFRGLINKPELTCPLKGTIVDNRNLKGTIIEEQILEGEFKD